MINHLLFAYILTSKFQIPVFIRDSSNQSQLLLYKKQKRFEIYVYTKCCVLYIKRKCKTLDNSYPSKLCQPLHGNVCHFVLKTLTSNDRQKTFPKVLAPPLTICQTNISTSKPCHDFWTSEVPKSTS